MHGSSILQKYEYVCHYYNQDCIFILFLGEEKIEKHQVQTQQVVTKQAPMKEPELPKPKPVEQPKLVEKPRPIEQPNPTPKQQPIPQRDTVDFAKTTQQDVFQNQTSFSSQQKSFSSTTTKQDHSEISMQMKSGGLMHDERQGPTMQINDYVGTLRPSTTGEEIRTPAPDAIYTSNRESVYNEEQLYSQAALRKTQAQKQGVFGGIAGDRNSLLTENPDLDYERHSVGNLVKHFSKIKSADINPQFLPQQYSAMQNSGEAPPLSYLKEQAATRVGKESKETNSSSDYTASTKKVMKETLEIEDAEERLKLFQRRGSLKDYLNIGLEIEDGKQQQQSSTLPSILDPSAILQGCKPFVSTDRPPSRTSLRATTASPMQYKSQYVAPKPFGASRPPRQPSIPRPTSRHSDNTQITSPSPIQPQIQDMTKHCIETNQINTDTLTQHMEEQLIVDQKKMTTMISVVDSSQAQGDIRQEEEVMQMEELKRKQEEQHQMLVKQEEEEMRRQQDVQKQQQMERQREQERQQEIQRQQEMQRQQEILKQQEIQNEKTEQELIVQVGL